MVRKRWIVIVTVCLLVCLITVSMAAWLAVQNIPGLARLFYGHSPTSPAIDALHPTVSPLQIATLTSTPPPSQPPATPALFVSPTAPPRTAGPGDVVTQEPTLGPSPTSTSVPPTATPPPEWLAFETKRGSLGDYEIFVMTTDGTRVTNLTNSWADDVSPVWSPDGRRIAFVSLRDTLTGKWGLGPGTIYIMDFDPVVGVANNLFRLTDGTSEDGWPTWSPDGRRVAFQSDRTGNWDIWVMNTDGSGLTQLTNHPEDDEHPDWSPDGKKIAFTSRREGNRDIWVMNADGSKPVNLTKTPSRDRYPMWSPDGRQIAFNTNRDDNQEIYVMNADGSNQRNVTNSPSIEGLADWSPDGKRLVLYSDRPGNKDIFIVDLTTGEWTDINRDPASDEFCTWSP